MHTESMSNAYGDTAWEWCIKRRAATTLPAASMLRWLQPPPQPAPKLLDRARAWWNSTHHRRPSLARAWRVEP